MIIKELKTLDVKVGDKMVNYYDFSDVYTVVRIVPNGFLVGRLEIVPLVIERSISYDIFGIAHINYDIKSKIKLAYIDELNRLIPL